MAKRKIPRTPFPPRIVPYLVADTETLATTRKMVEASADVVRRAEPMFSGPAWERSKARMAHWSRQLDEACKDAYAAAADYGQAMIVRAIAADGDPRQLLMFDHLCQAFARLERKLPERERIRYGYDLLSDEEIRDLRVYALTLLETVVDLEAKQRNPLPVVEFGALLEGLPDEACFGLFERLDPEVLDTDPAVAEENYRGAVRRARATERKLVHFEERLTRRADRLMDYLRELIPEEMEPGGSDSEPRDMFTELLPLLLLQHYQAVGQMSDREMGEVYYDLFRFSSVAWQTVLGTMFTAYGAVGSGPFARNAPWLGDLVAAMLRQPRRLKRHRCPQEAQKLRNLLAARVGPMLAGCESKRRRLAEEVERAVHRFESDGASAAGFMTAVACRSVFHGCGEEREDWEAGREAALALGRQWLEPHVVAVALRLEVDVQFPLDLGLRSSEATAGVPEGIDARPEPSWEPVEIDEDEEDLEVDRHAQRSLPWYYVSHPTRIGKEGELVSAPDDEARDKKVAAFYKRKRLPLDVKPDSVAHALEYFESHDPVQRTLIPHETFGEVTWQKLKRGGVRILVRLEEDGLRFHTYNRAEYAGKGRLH